MLKVIQGWLPKPPKKTRISYISVLVPIFIVLGSVIAMTAWRQATTPTTTPTTTTSAPTVVAKEASPTQETVTFDGDIGGTVITNVWESTSNLHFRANYIRGHVPDPPILFFMPEDLWEEFYGEHEGGDFEMYIYFKRKGKMSSEAWMGFWWVEGGKYKLLGSGTYTQDKDGNYHVTIEAKIYEARFRERGGWVDILKWGPAEVKFSFFVTSSDG